MTTVQVTIQDPVYADSIRELLLGDGNHLVHVVESPDTELEGVIIIDSAHLDGHWMLANESERLVVIVRKHCDILPKIWDAGVRHVVFHEDTPQAAFIVVLCVELVLGFIEANAPACGISPYSSIRPATSHGSTRPIRCRARTAPPRH